jgi:hypothetical protein
MEGLLVRVGGTVLEPGVDVCLGFRTRPTRRGAACATHGMGNANPGIRERGRHLVAGAAGSRDTSVRTKLPVGGVAGTVSQVFLGFADVQWPTGRWCNPDGSWDRRRRMDDRTQRTVRDDVGCGGRACVAKESSAPKEVNELGFLAKGRLPKQAKTTRSGEARTPARTDDRLLWTDSRCRMNRRIR